MKSVEKKTPPSTKVADRSSVSGKKLVQARLPFKVISSTTGTGQSPSPAIKPVSAKDVSAKSKDESTPNELVSKKRKLSYSEEPEDRGTKKVACGLDGEAKENEVVVLDDDDAVEAVRGTEGAVVKEPSDKSLEPVVRLEKIDAMISKLKNDKTGRIVLSSPKTPNERKKSAVKGNDGTPVSSSKFQIKLPLSTHKKKRKQLQKEEQCDSGSDLEIVESHPEKKLKTNDGSELRKFVALKSPQPVTEVRILQKIVYNKSTLNTAKDNGKDSQEKAEKPNSEEVVCLSDEDGPPENKTTGSKSPEKSTKTNDSIEEKTTVKGTPKGKKDEPADQKKILDFAKGTTPKKPVTSSDTVDEESINSEIKGSDGDPVCISSSEEEDKGSQSKKSQDSDKVEEKSAENDTKESSSESKNSSRESDSKESSSESKNSSRENEDSESRQSKPDETVEVYSDSSNHSSPSATSNDKSGTSDEPKEDPSVALNTSTTNTPRLRKSLPNAGSDKKLTREERERKIQEEKLQKQREKDEKERQRKKEKEEKEEQKRREREEKEEQRRKEREEKEEQRRKEKEEKEDQRRKEKEEKEEQRRKEKEEKEKKRLAELEQKNEERRKKEEAKEEERRKKEDERRKKELEKEEEENKKKKAAQAFTKFFIAKPVSKTDDRLSIDSDIQLTKNNFMPFRIKDHMKLAPLYRKRLTRENKSALETVLESDECASKENLYLNCLKTGKVTPGKDTRTLGTEDDTSDDVVILGEDELKDAGLEIDDEKKCVQTFRAKYFLFHENVRPPYRGTWRKKSSVVGPRKPFATDKAVFDYEVDSDDEWEEEEPGESLDDVSEEEKEPEDEYEVDNEFFVPHGHLSDEELQNEDELDEDNSPETQKAKLKILQQEFAKEMTKKTEKIKPRLIGVIWTDVNGNQPESCPNIVWQSLTKRAMIFTEPIVLTEPEPLVSETTTTTQKVKLTDELVRDLIRLVHHNRHSKKFLVREFQAYLNDKFGKDETFPNYSKASIQKKIEKLAKWEISDDETRKKKKKLCWIVGLESLERYTMEDIDKQNAWQYILQPKGELTGAAKKDDEQHQQPAVADEKAESNDGKPKTPAVITKFTKVLSELEKAKQFDSVASSPSSDKKTKNELNNSRIPTTPSVDLTKDPAPATSKSATLTTTKPATPASGKKRVALLMSVPRGQKVNEEKKKDLISKFLRKDIKESATEESKNIETQQTPKSQSKDKPTVSNEVIDIGSSPEKPKSKPPTKTNKTPSQQSGSKSKKRVPLLMSVARGETIPEDKKNDVISKFLKKDEKSDMCKEDANKNLQILSSEKVTPMDVDPPSDAVQAN